MLESFSVVLQPDDHVAHDCAALSCCLAIKAVNVQQLHLNVDSHVFVSFKFFIGSRIHLKVLQQLNWGFSIQITE